MIYNYIVKIMKSNLRKTFFYALVALFVLGCDSTKKKPNFVFIYTDDQRFDTVGLIGNNEVKTPHLDDLANNGAVFSHAYNMGAWHGAICVASRSMIISGKSVWNAKREVEESKDKSELIKNTWPRLFKQNGYNTYMTGKWHVQLPIEKIFDSIKNKRPGMPDDNRGLFAEGLWKWQKESGNVENLSEYMPIGYGRPVDEFDKTWNPDDSIHGGFWQGGKHWSEVLADDANDLIDDAANNQSPFFMYLAFNAPHDPRQAPKKFLDLYPLDSIKLPPNYKENHPYFNEIGSMPGVRDESLAPYPRNEFAIKKHIQEYYAIISHLDEQVGKIIDHLKKRDLIDNTYIIFTSDHGLAVGQHGLIGKQSLYDHSIRVPMIISGPNIKKGSWYNQDIYLQDIVPTSLDLANIEVSSEMDFNSFKEILFDESSDQINNGIYGTYGCCPGNYFNYQRIIRKDGFKLMFFPKNQRIELYNVEDDPFELNNLAGDENYYEKILSLGNDFIELQNNYNDTLNIKKIFKNIWKDSKS